MKVVLGIVYNVAPYEICFIITYILKHPEKTDSFVESLALIKVLAT